MARMETSIHNGSVPMEITSGVVEVTRLGPVGLYRIDLVHQAVINGEGNSNPIPIIDLDVTEQRIGHYAQAWRAKDPEKVIHVTENIQGRDWRHTGGITRQNDTGKTTEDGHRIVTGLEFYPGGKVVVTGFIREEQPDKSGVIPIKLKRKYTERSRPKTVFRRKR